MGQGKWFNNESRDEDEDTDDDDNNDENLSNDDEANNEGEEGHMSESSSSSSESSLHDPDTSVVLDLPPPLPPVQSHAQSEMLSTKLSEAQHRGNSRGSSRSAQKSVKHHHRENFLPKSLQMAVSKRSFDALEGDGWCIQRSQSEFIGKCVRRFFPGYGLADGVVVAHMSGEDNDGHPLWHVVHADGDSEDISEDDFELCHDIFVRDITSVRSLSRQKNPPGPPSEEGDSSDSSRLSSASRSRRRHKKPFMTSLPATEHHKRAPFEQRVSEYILQESFEAKEIREGDDYQVSADHIPTAVPYVPPATTSPLSHSFDHLHMSPSRRRECMEFLSWGKKQFLRPGMLTMALVPSARVALATPLDGTESSSGGGGDGGLEPVLHYVQRYCVVVSELPSEEPSDTAQDDKLVVFDGGTHHVVSMQLCSPFNPPLVTEPAQISLTPGQNVNRSGGTESNDSTSAVPSMHATSLANEMKMICFLEMWNDSEDPRKTVMDLCKDICERQLTEEGMAAFLGLWREHKQALEQYHPVMRRLGVDHKQVVGLYQLLLPFLSTSSEEKACQQLRGVHRLADLLRGKKAYLPPGYSHLPQNFHIRSNISTNEAALGSSAVLVSREVNGEFGDESDNEEIFVPKFVIPRKQTVNVRFPPSSSQQLAAKRSPRTSGGGVVRKVEKYDLRTGEVLAEYANQSKAALENEGITQSQISAWCRGRFANTKKEFAHGYRFSSDPSSSSGADTAAGADSPDEKEKEKEKEEHGETSDEDKEEKRGKVATLPPVSPPNPHPLFSYELDDGRFQIDRSDAMFPVCSLTSAHPRGGGSGSRCVGGSSPRHQRQHDRHRQPESYSLSDVMNKKTFARQAAARVFGYSARQEEFRVAAREGERQRQRQRAVPLEGFADYPPQYRRRSSGKKAVEQYDYLTGVTIKIYPSGAEAAKALGISPNTVSCCCTGRMKNADGFGFRFVDERDRQFVKRSRKVAESVESRQLATGTGRGRGSGNGKAVEQYDILTGKSMQVFTSGMEAARVLGVQQSSVSQCCVGRKPSVGSYGFRFVDRRRFTKNDSDSDNSSSSDDSDAEVSRARRRRPGPRPVASEGAGGVETGRRKAIEQYDFASGKHIATFSSARECSHATGITRYAIELCCSGRQEGVDDYGFRFVDAFEGDAGDSSDDSSDLKSHGSGGQRKAVEQYRLDTGETVAEFASTSHAADSLGEQKSAISLCCIGRQNGIGEWGFRFADTADRGATNGSKRKPVEQFDFVTGETMETFASGKDAAKALGLNRTTVSLCCIGRQKSIDEQYGFRFADPEERERAEKSETFRKSYVQSQQLRDEITVREVEVYDVVTGDTIQTFVSGVKPGEVLGINPRAITLCCSGMLDRMGDISFRFAASDKSLISKNRDEGRGGDERVNMESNTADRNSHAGGTRGTIKSLVSNADKTVHSLKAVEQYDIRSGATLQNFASSTHAGVGGLGVTRLAVSLCCIGCLEGVGSFSFRFMDKDEIDLVASSVASWRLPPPAPPPRGTKQFKAVEQYDLETGECMQTFKSGAEAARVLGLYASTVSMCCTGQQLGGVNGGYSFRFCNRQNRTNHYSDGNEDEENDDGEDGGTAGTRSRAVKRSASFLSGPRKRHALNSPKGTGSSVVRVRREVVQYDLRTKQVLATFPSGNRAAHELGLNQSTVSQCCRGKVKSVGGFGFRFAPSPDDEGSGGGDDEEMRDAGNAQWRHQDQLREGEGVRHDLAAVSSGGGGLDSGSVSAAGGHVLLKQAQGLAPTLAKPLPSIAPLLSISSSATSSGHVASSPLPAPLLAGGGEYGNGAKDSKEAGGTGMEE